MKTGDTLKLVCTSKGGNPLAEVYWYKDDTEIDFSYTSGGDKSVNELVFTVQPNDNEAVYRCEASNLVTPTPLKAEERLIVQCEYIVSKGYVLKCNFIFRTEMERNSAIISFSNISNEQSGLC